MNIILKINAVISNNYNLTMYIYLHVVNLSIVYIKLTHTRIYYMHLKKKKTFIIYNIKTCLYFQFKKI